MGGIKHSSINHSTMKRTCITLLLSVVAFWAMAQAPNATCYSALAHDVFGNVLANQEVTIRLSVLRDGPTGSVEYQEIHKTQTNDQGLFAVNLGEGEITGNGAQDEFRNVDWANGTYWLKVEMDATGGQNFELMGVSQILSVVYALHANEASHAVQSDTALVAQTALAAVQTIGDDDGDPTNEIQTLSKNGNVIELSNGGGQVVDDVDDADNDPTNELQTLSFSNGELSISGGNSIFFYDSPFSAPGSSADLPLGIVGEHMVLTTGDYIVPPDKVFFVTAGGPNIILNGYGNLTGVHVHPTTPNMPVFPPNTHITDCMCTGILIDTSSFAQPVIIDLTFGSYLVPSGKVLFIKSGIPNDQTGKLVVNNVLMEFLRPNFTRGTRIISFPAGTIIKKPSDLDEMVLTGYLIDAN